MPELRHTEGIGPIEASVFGLLGLLLAFSFAGGTSRLDTRRQLIVEEANAIGTAYLRLDLVAVANQPEMRRLFREYLDSRLRVYETLRDVAATERRWSALPPSRSGYGPGQSLRARLRTHGPLQYCYCRRSIR